MHRSHPHANTSKHCVPLWGGNRSKGRLWYSKIFQLLEVFPLISWVAVLWVESEYLCLRPVTQRWITKWSKPSSASFTLSERKTSFQRGPKAEKACAAGCGGRAGGRGVMRVGRLIPDCHYPHFLATVCRLPHNEGQLQGFAPGTDANSTVHTLEKRSAGRDLRTTSVELC